MEVDLETVVTSEGGARLEAVRRAAKTWTGQLVDLTGRNNLLYYRDLKVGTLSLDDSARQPIYDALAGRTVLLSKLFAEEEGLEDALKRARSVRNKANAHFEERGIETLYLACGMATWSGQKSASTPAAPVLLVPLRLAPKGAAQEEFELTVTGELEVNPTFLQMLKAEFDISCDPVELLESAGIEGVIDTPEELDVSFAWLGRKCSSVPGFEIRERFVVGNFSYARMPMVRDLENSIEAMAEHDIVAALAGDEGAQGLLRARGAAATVPSPDFIPPSDEFLVLDADASQNYAINAVLAGKDLIIKGPPGTGKSQTISNLISTLVARGKRVLFVAEKRAAIDAVLRRLDKVGLGDLVLDLHGGVSSKRKVAEALNEALGRNASLAKPKTEGLHRVLAQRREQLNEHAKALHEERAPWGISFFDAHAQLLDLPESVTSQVRFRGPTLEGFGEEELARATETLQTYVGLGGLQLRHSGSPWAQTTVVSEDEAAERRAEVEALRRTLPEILANLSRAAAETGVREPATVRAWDDQFALWRRIEELYETWKPSLYELSLDQTIEDAAPLEESAMTRVAATLTDAEYRTAKKALRNALCEGKRLSAQELHDAASSARDLRQDWMAVAVEADSVPVSPKTIDVLQAGYNEIWSRLQALARHLGRDAIDGSPDDVLGLLDALLADATTLAKLPELHRLRTDLNASLLSELLESLDALPLDRAEAAAVLRFVWLTSLVEHLEFADPRIGSFDGAQHHELVREFQEVDREHIETTPQRVRRLCAEQAIQAEDESPENARLIRAEASKKRKHLATRQLFSAAPEVMTAVKPCWAMSPLVVSQLLPSDRPHFDVVVFDEASQIRPAEAMAAVLRGKQLVVAGDERQLPPSAFFNTTNPEADADEADGSYLAVDSSYESILEALAAFIDFRVLEWHYRSRDERLINFSNVHMYDRGMTTFPGVVGPDCVRHVPVVHTPGEIGSETSAGAEVNKVVELILEHASERPGQSLGVIAMGINHAERISEALRVAMSEREEEFGDFFDDSRQEPFFVKNLERVQGDERDAIILSVGYGKNADGRLLYRFGPLNMEGGERRLNVAVTRAKERMTLVSSFDHRDMDPERSQARGVQLLRSYLEYCASKGTQLGERAESTPELNPFEVDVRDGLVRAGIQLDAQHGCSGYRIDFAAKHPTRPGRMVLAIECDGATYHSSQSARDRDRLRQEHLERLGWTFHRIWSQDWFADRQGETERAKAAYETAVAAADEADAADDEETGGEDVGEGNPDNGPTPTDPPGVVSVEQGTAADKLRDRKPCPIRTGRSSIEEYSPRELARLIQWIESDTLLRTKEQLLDEAIRELGFKRRGKRIVDAVEQATAVARSEGR
jgi:very-short-patch-repair endonuclease/DNA polymerase III delta prime subunit